MMRWAVFGFGLFLGVSEVRGGLVVEPGPQSVTVKGDHFALTIDRTKGGEVSELRLFDGAQWNTVLAAPAITFPAVKLRDGQKEYALANDRGAEMVRQVVGPEKVVLEVRATPLAADGAASPWRITLTYEIYTEGAVFVDVDYRLKEGTFDLTGSSVSFSVSDDIRKGPKYRDRNTAASIGGFRSARVAFGSNPDRSFTNEIEVVVEHKLAMAGAVSEEQKDGRFTWTLGNGGSKLKAPWHYHNRMAMGLGAAVTGKPKSNVVGHRVFHWVNWLDTRNWYPSNEQIDKMIALGGTMLILHHEWMRQRGSNGHPHADYAVVRNHEEMVRTIARAHAKGMRLGLYMRGVEMYGLKAKFFPKYCRRDWDGIYVDWHGAACRSYHDSRFAPDPNFADFHFSPKGTHVPAREYFLFAKELRDIVGPGGFLIGHQGTMNPGVLANLCFDAYLPGESASDHDMFSDVDNAVYKGMMGGGVCMPWTLDSPFYRSPEGAAKMAAWGFYPHIVLGLGPPRTKDIFSCEPDDPVYAQILPYWRVLSKADAENLTVFNLPAQNVVAMTSSNPACRGLVYKEGKDAYLVIVANLGKQPAKTQLVLKTDVLGMSGRYEVARIDSATGQMHPCGESQGALTTSELPPWGIEGFKLCRK